LPAALCDLFSILNVQNYLLFVLCVGFDMGVYQVLLLEEMGDVEDILQLMLRKKEIGTMESIM